MLLKRGLGISNAKTWLNWLRKWAVRVVVTGNMWAFLLLAGKSQNKKNYKF